MEEKLQREKTYKREAYERKKELASSIYSISSTSHSSHQTNVQNNISNIRPNHLQGSSNKLMSQYSMGTNVE